MKRKVLSIGCRVLVIGFLISVIAFPGFGSIDAKEARGVTDDTMKIGAFGDLTGPIAQTWKPLGQALRTYFQNVNDKGGIHGRKIKYVLEDDRYSIPMALSAFKKLVFRDKVLALVPAASGAGHTHAIVPLCQKEKVPLIATTTNRKIFEPVQRYIFGPLPYYEDQVCLEFEYIFEDLKLSNPRIALAYPDQEAGKNTRDSARRQAKAYNVKILREVVISTGAIDFTSQILNLKRVKPDYIFLHAYTGSGSAFMRDAMKFGLSATFIISQYGCDEETLMLAGKAAKTMIGANGFASWHDNSPGMVKLREISLKYNPSLKRPGRVYMQGWTIATIFCEGLKKTGRDLNEETLVEGLERITGLDTGGVTGIIDFGPDDHKALEYSRLFKTDVEKKVLVPITDWRKARYKK